ncbi:Predicted arabinose efflux permease, MFS family [Streptomyces sp. 1222.5]|uniref:YbfB/YjiJ family MFS transporter n=1 Tax=unclassified Streptomyces TaxID=2593676 RepID=UPI00089C09EC|nr:putative MFS family arabinose efflux permease [Streptomyces sp. 5112.2]SED40919.1 Predicted arabinose efflux permease, MFS family [Streptomyces sp. 1222.5]
MPVRHLRAASARTGGLSPSPRVHVARTAAALAAAMGIGRFVFTPILPLMHAQAGLSVSAGANLATANYVGYLAGALAGIFAPALVRSPALLRVALVVLTGTLAAMPATHDAHLWITLRLLAGAASALVFVLAVGSLHSNLRGHPAHLSGWAFGGVGTGIALSGLLVLVLHSVADWRVAWWASAALAALFTAGAWRLRPETAPVREPRKEPGAAPGAGTPAAERTTTRTRRWFTTLFASYTLEGVGYIVAGTFLVAAIEQSSPGPVGNAAWVLVGLAAVPSSALWAGLGRRWSHPDLLLAALVVQATGIALPALIGGVTAALISAVLFGATFIGVSTLALAAGAHLWFPRSVALLTAGYSVGQILGPLVVAPLLHHGYHRALIVAAVVVLAAAGAAGLLRIGFPSQGVVPRGAVNGRRTGATPTAGPDRGGA